MKLKKESSNKKKVNLNMNINNKYFNDMNYLDSEQRYSPTNLEMFFGNKLSNNNYKNDNYDFLLKKDYPYKTIHLYYDGEYIQDVKIDKSESVGEIREKFKSILYKIGKVSYRPAFSEETIERENPFETLEYLLNRGIIDPSPSVSFFNNNTLGKYPPMCYNFKLINEGDRLEVKYGDKIIGSGGFCSLEFVDLDESTKFKVLKFSKKAPEWRKVSVGLNLFGKCLNKNCKAYNKEVINIVGINRKFDFLINKKAIICPACSKNFIPITLGFWKCEYQIKGEKLKNGEYEDVEINGKETEGENFEYFDPYSNGTTFWSSLMIFTGHRQKMKYRKNAI